MFENKILIFIKKSAISIFQQVIYYFYYHNYFNNSDGAKKQELMQIVNKKCITNRYLEKNF